MIPAANAIEPIRSADERLPIATAPVCEALLLIPPTTVELIPLAVPPLPPATTDCVPDAVLLIPPAMTASNPDATCVAADLMFCRSTAQAPRTLPPMAVESGSVAAIGAVLLA